MKKIWYIERKSYRMNEKGIAEQVEDAGQELKLYETFKIANIIFESYKRGYKDQGNIRNEEEFPYKSFSINSKYLKNYYTVYSLRPVHLKQKLIDE